MKILKFYVDLCVANSEVEKLLTLTKRLTKFIYAKFEDNTERIHIATSLLFDYTLLCLLDVMYKELFITCNSDDDVIVIEEKNVNWLKLLYDL